MAFSPTPEMKRPPTLAALAAPRGAGQSLGAALLD
jgi:hypothetical protein